MVFEFNCSLVVVNNFEVVVEFFEVIVGGCWSFLLLQLFTTPRFELVCVLLRNKKCLRNIDILPASDLLFGSRLIFKQSYLAWSDYILNFNEMTSGKPRIRKPRNSLCKQLTLSGRRSTIPSCYFAFM